MTKRRINTLLATGLLLVVIVVTGGESRWGEGLRSRLDDLVPAGEVTSTDARVARVIDGDTVELSDGATVRLAGIDTPERGACGFDDASRNLQRIVEGQQITLVLTDDAPDRYGRLLGYLDLPDGTDAGLEQLAAGAAIARYDSRDGYGPHPREAQYVQTDDATPHACPGWD